MNRTVASSFSVATLTRALCKTILVSLESEQSGKSLSSGPLKATIERVTAKEFFETVAPGTVVQVADGTAPHQTSTGILYEVKPILIDLHCESCGGIRTFEKTDESVMALHGKPTPVYIKFDCRNCARTRKLYSVLIHQKPDGCTMQKLAEVPDFGPPTPARVFKLIGEQRDYYLKGRRCENQGLGIGAFAYYRRAVEKEKDRIFDEVIRTAKKLRAGEDLIRDLEEARRETQFTAAVERIRLGVPQALLINGHNPLTLLHSAISEGLHAQTDEDCLKMATTIRIVLTDLAQRTGSVLKEQAELDSAVSRLMAAKDKKAPKASGG